MQKIIISLLSITFFISCSNKKTNSNLQITGYIKGLTKGTIYIQKIKDTLLVPLDTIKINGDSHFISELNIDSPEMYYLFIDRGVSNSVDNSIPFFAEKGKINITTSLDFFTSDAKITGSKNQELYDEYRKVVSRYVDKDLQLIKKRFYALRDKKTSEISKIEEQQANILKSKYLYTTNFAVNHADYEVAPYVALAEISDINLKFLDTIQKSMTPKISKSMYGEKLKEYYKERVKNEL